MQETFTARRKLMTLALGLAASVGWAANAQADINIGVILSTTGPGASLGIPAENTIKLWPTLTFTRRIDALPPKYTAESSETFTLWSSNMTPLATAPGPSIGSERATFRTDKPLTGNGSTSPIFGRVRAEVQ